MIRWSISECLWADEPVRRVPGGRPWSRRRGAASSRRASRGRRRRRSRAGPWPRPGPPAGGRRRGTARPVARRRRTSAPPPAPPSSWTRRTSPLGAAIRASPRRGSAATRGPCASPAPKSSDKQSRDSVVRATNRRLRLCRLGDDFKLIKYPPVVAATSGELAIPISAKQVRYSNHSLSHEHELKRKSSLGARTTKNSLKIEYISRSRCCFYFEVTLARGLEQFGGAGQGQHQRVGVAAVVEANVDGGRQVARQQGLAQSAVDRVVGGDAQRLQRRFRRRFRRLRRRRRGSRRRNGRRRQSDLIEQVRWVQRSRL